MALNKHLLSVRELKQEGRASPWSTAAGNLCGRWLLAMPVNDYKSTLNIDLGVT